MEKLKRKTIPSGHSLNDFKCFGPAVEKDGEFEGYMLCDMGCFKQDLSDTNKYYNASVCQSKQDDGWYVYFEWGKVGGANDFQFYKCNSKDEAESIFCKQLHSKNDKRGEWYDDPILGRILRAKAKKDCYLVRPQTVRSTGLPDAKNIAKVVDAPNIQKYTPEVTSLLRDLKTGTSDYARTSMSTSAIPTMDAIEQARLICQEAAKGKNLEELTSMLYSRIPKTKYKNENYLLSGDNIKRWLDDLDAYEDAIKSMDTKTASEDFELEYISDRNILSGIEEYFNNGTRNRHSWCKGQIKIANVWKVVRNDVDKFYEQQDAISKYKKKFKKKPFFISKNFSRFDLDNDDLVWYNQSNTHLLFHGTRSVNVGLILKNNLKLPSELKGVSINGALGGPGIYAADDWKKSAGYCSIPNSYWARGSGHIKNRGGFMFLFDFAMGEPYVVDRPKSFNTSPDGHHSVMFEAGGYVQNSEFIIYNKHQQTLRYLVEFNV